jgi:hypothetical protein
LFVAAAVLWARSYRAHDVLSWTQAEDVGGSRYGWYRVVASGRGRFAYSCDAEVYQRSSVTAEEAARPVGRWQWEGWQREFVGCPAPGFGGPSSHRLGFHLAWRGDGSTVRREVILPYWAVVLPAALLPALWVLRNLCRRVRPGACPVCGYDLRATPDRCPECDAFAATPA